MAEDFRIGNGGSVLHLSFKVNGSAFPITGCISKKIIIRKKDATIVIKDAEFDGTLDGSDGKIKYTFSSEDLNQEGEWKVQGFARFSSTSQVYTSIVSFKVGSNLAIIP